MKSILHEASLQLKRSVWLLLMLILLTGVIYPAIVTVIAQQFFPHQANGSMLEVEGHVIGSRLIGQFFNTPDYFWGRPSATFDHPYNALASGGSNNGPSNPQFIFTVKERVTSVRINTKPELLVPVDLVTSSASGLDPDISPYAAFYQVERIAKARHIKPELLVDLIQSQVIPRTFGLLGEPRVNVVMLNLELDKLRSAHGRAPSKSR